MTAVVSGVRVVVTGSTRGLGLAVAERLSAADALIVVNGTDPERCAALADRLGAATVSGRVEDPGVAEALVSRCVTTYGGIDAVVNNAGMTRDAMLTRMTAEDFRSVLAAADGESKDMFGEPDSVAGIFEYLCSPRSRGMTGQVLSFDGRRLGVWSHPEASAEFGGADMHWNAVEFDSALSDRSAWEPLHPDRLGRLLQGSKKTTR